MYKTLAIVLMLLIQSSWAELLISGKVKNANGNAPQFADVHLVELGTHTSQPIKSVHVEKNGQFTLKAESGRDYTLYVTAADHVGYAVPLLAAELNKVQVNIQLKTNAYKDTFEGVKIIGDWNRFSFRSAQDMEKQADGTFVFTHKTDADEVAYQLIGLDGDGHSVNGTMSDKLVYDGGGDYRSVVKTTNGMVKIVFDPAKLTRAQKSNTQKVEFSDPILNAVAQIAQKSDAAFSDYRKAYSAYRQKNKNTEGFEYDFTKIASFLKSKMNSDKKQVARYAAVRLINTGYEKEDAQAVTTLLPITDPLWNLAPFSLTDIYAQAYGKEKANTMINEAFDNIPSEKVKAKILVVQGMEAKENDQMQKVATIFKRLSTEFASQKKELRWYLGELDPNKAIVKGKQVPDFDVQLMHSEERVSKKSLLGSYYLIDFWAVWCGPCRAEMPNLHAVYEDFKDLNFKILSLSFDPKASAVDAYREKTWPMPWLHTFVEKGFQNPLSKRFEVQGIPKPILVNNKGVIIATGSELRGDNLKKTLTKHLKGTM